MKTKTSTMDVVEKVERHFSNKNKHTKWLAALCLLLVAFSGGTLQAQWQSNGSDISNSNSGNVGIGTSAPIRKLHVSDGDILLDNNRYLRNLRTDGLGPTHQVFGMDSNNDMILNRSAIVHGQPSRTIIGFGGAGRTLDVRNQSNTTVLRVTGSGNVGIGDLNPLDKLSVAGVIASSTGGFKFPDGTVQTTAATGGSGGVNQTLSISGHNLSISGGNTVTLPDDVNDADADPVNELQSISKSGTTVSLSNGGGSFTDAVDDADADPNNEIQTLSINGSNLSISGGNTISLPAAGGNSPWTESSGNVYRSSGNVGIGTSNPVNALDVVGAINTNGEYKIENDIILHRRGTASISLGSGAGLNNTGFGNVYVGASAGGSGTGGNDNVAIGRFAGASLTSGFVNVFIGTKSGELNTTGKENVFLGSYAGSSNTDGDGNIFIGSTTGEDNTTGTSNVYIGRAAGSNSTTGQENIFIGSLAGLNNITGEGNVFIGHKAGQFETGSNKLYITNNSTSPPLVHGDFSTNELKVNGTMEADAFKLNGQIITSWPSGGGSSSPWAESGNDVYRSSGSVGIGTSNPDRVLHVKASSDKNIRLEEDGSGSEYFEIGIDNSGHFKVFEDNGNVAFTILDGSGRVGIGNENPEGQLHVGTGYGARIHLGDEEFMADGGDNVLVCGYASFIPYDDNTYDLGHSNYRWDDVFATNGTINTSDIRDKENIKELGYGLKHILQLKPVRYTWKNKPEKGIKLGLIAQDLQKILPEVVYDPERDVQFGQGGPAKSTSKNARLGVYYSDIIPVLIKSIQEQQVLIESLEEQVSDMKKNAKKQLSEMKHYKEDEHASTKPLENGSNKKKTETEETVLYQNVPNPFSKSTEIRYLLPEATEQAFIAVYTMSGLQVKRFDDLQNGEGSLEIDGGQLQAGMYLYSLVVNGQEVDTKRMILTD